MVTASTATTAPRTASKNQAETEQNSKRVVKGVTRESPKTSANCSGVIQRLRSNSRCRTATVGSPPPSVVLPMRKKAAAICSSVGMSILYRETFRPPRPADFNRQAPDVRFPAGAYNTIVKVLTTAQMREVDRRTIQAGIPGIVLMENAGHRVVEFLAEKFAPLENHRIVVLCGKGNNGGDGMVAARQRYTRFKPQPLDVGVAGDPREMHGAAGEDVPNAPGAGRPVAL